jgi:hypothetical protein
MLNPFTKPSIENKVEKQIGEAKLALLLSLDAVEYAQSMVDFNTKRLNRLLSSPLNMQDVSKSTGLVVDEVHA